MMLMRAVVLLLAFAVDGFGQNASSTQPVQPQIRELHLLGGFSRYSFEEFNDKLSREGNRRIKGGGTFGAEVSVVDVPLPKPLGGSAKTPLGLEVITASSKTTQTFPEGSVTIQWNVPVVGVYSSVAFIFGQNEEERPSPDMQSDKLKISARDVQWFIRPLGIGYYALGRWWAAKLTVSDRPGRLVAHGSTVGLTSSAGIRYVMVRQLLLLEGGFRHFVMSDIVVEPRDGFVEKPQGATFQAGSLRESLDYSGVFIRGGVGVRF
jgi:hypothetical protein